MVKEEIEGEKKVFTCEECGFCYSGRQWAEKCESWCSEHLSCNTEITKHALGIK